MKLVENAREAWRWFSVQAMTLATALQGAWLTLSDSQRAGLPGVILSTVTIAVLVLGFIGRLVKQDLPPPKDADGLPPTEHHSDFTGLNKR